ncbi:MAG: DUF1801 domain-containing protein [Bacteroidales bacterium]|nr:DUF1801 domain-containing protein [Bacteroidales bacterium]
MVAKVEIKTKENEQSVEAFLNSVENEQKRADSFSLLEIYKDVTGLKPKMWGDSIIGFGNAHLKYASGREIDYFKIGFSPRKQNLALYLSIYGFEKNQGIINNLGKHKMGKGCLYINKLADINRDILKDLISKSL